MVQTWDELQEAVGLWAVDRFGENESPDLGTRLGAAAPALGLIEELGELDEAPDHAAAVNAIADSVIFCCDFCRRSGLRISEMIERLPPPPPLGGEPVHLGRDVLKWAGRFCHAVLKRHQGIRGFASPELYRDEVSDALESILEILRNMVAELGFDFFTVCRDVFVREVAARNWRARPTSG